ncbi:MAG: iron-containing alcohol dehydrogenase [Alphaproteobacteria bacterium]
MLFPLRRAPEPRLTPWTVITNTETNEKTGYGIPETFPALAIVDPALMTSVPTKADGLPGNGRLFHAAEGYLACVAQPISDLLALEAIRQITKFLPQAVEDGNNLQAREQMAWASTAAGIIESTSSCISEHSMEHALSAFLSSICRTGQGWWLCRFHILVIFSKKMPKK